MIGYPCDFYLCNCSYHFLTFTTDDDINNIQEHLMLREHIYGMMNVFKKNSNQKKWRLLLTPQSQVLHKSNNLVFK